MVLVIFCSIVAEKARNSVSRSLRSMRIRASVSFIPRGFYTEKGLIGKAAEHFDNLVEKRDG